MMRRFLQPEGKGLYIFIALAVLAWLAYETVKPGLHDPRALPRAIEAR
ncbi:MAG: hypothetical protein HQQ73_08685, partial [Desulfobulbaceae bacterium]|nr:hypothetical protein [Desulfobulbaceae bacterium]